MKKTTLLMITSATILLAAPGDGMPMQGMRGQGKGMMNPKCKMMHTKMTKKKMNSPFLIKHGLPHLTKMIMPYLNDPAFNLTATQKEKLAEIRKETIGTIKQLKPEIMQLKKEIVSASNSGTSADSLKSKVEKLADLEAKATMVHLKCIEKTKNILTKDQLLFLLAKKNKMKNMKGQKKMKMMKCSSGKCGGMMGEGKAKMMQNQ